MDATSLNAYLSWSKLPSNVGGLKTAVTGHSRLFLKCRAKGTRRKYQVSK
jgi:hypothetical protein